MQRLSWFVTIIAVFALQHSVPLSLGQDAAKKVRTETAGSQKPAAVNFFDPIFDVASVQKAIGKGDASDIADAGLQLRESERVLLRSHPAIESAEVLELAVRKAVATGDFSTLDRLDLLAKQQELTDLGQKIAIARKLASNARAEDSHLSIDPQSTTVVQFDAIKDFKQRLNHAALIGDRRAIAELESQVKGINNLQLQDYLQQAIKAAKASIPADHPQPSAFLRLAGESRGWGIRDLNSTNNNSDVRKSAK